MESCPFLCESMNKNAPTGEMIHIILFMFDWKFPNEIRKKKKNNKQTVQRTMGNFLSFIHKNKKCIVYLEFPVAILRVSVKHELQEKCEHTKFNCIVTKTKIRTYFFFFESLYFFRCIYPFDTWPNRR